MTPVAVLHLMNEFEDCGISRIVQHLVQDLGQQDYGWHIGGLRGPGDMREEFSRLGIQVVDFSDRQNGSGNLTRRIREYILAHQIRIVHTHSPRTVLAAAMALAATHQTIHLATEHLLNAPGDRRWGLIYVLVDRFSLYLPDQIIAVSQKMYHQIVALPGLSARRVTMIRNAVDCESFYVPDQRGSCRSEFSLAAESQVIGYAGRIEKMKRLDLLLEGFSLVLARHPRARLMIIGEGQLRPKLEALADSLGISHAVTWTGFRQDIPRLLAAMDVYVQPSANEGLPLSILEAMAAGKPVVATPAGGVVELIQDEVTGLLVPPNDPAALAVAILRLLEDKGLAEQVRRQARFHVADRFNLQGMVQGYDALYQSLLG